MKPPIMCWRALLLTSIVVISVKTQSHGVSAHDSPLHLMHYYLWDLRGGVAARFWREHAARAFGLHVEALVSPSRTPNVCEGGVHLHAAPPARITEHLWHLARGTSEGTRGRASSACSPPSVPGACVAAAEGIASIGSGWP